MTHYPFGEIEPKWQKRWEDEELFRCRTDAENRFYCLVMYPYPSGDLHVGHGRNYIIGDAVARYHMMRGKSVLTPMGWDAFGLPAENAAIERGIHPPVWTDGNIVKMKDQFRRWGIGYDWSREFASHEEDFYRWTQWIFLRLFDEGLAYRKAAPVNWCPSCATVLANEQVVEGKCERCDAVVSTRDLEQWFFKITEYGDRLLEGLDTLSAWPERVRTMQRNWIGRSEGVEIDFKVAETGSPLPCFTTRVDTVFGVTYMVMAAEHPLLGELVRGTEREDEVLAFAERVRAQSQFERGAADVRKEGVWTGRHVVNPVNGERVADVHIYAEPADDNEAKSVDDAAPSHAPQTRHTVRKPPIADGRSSNERETVNPAYRDLFKKRTRDADRPNRRPTAELNAPSVAPEAVLFAQLTTAFEVYPV